MPFIIANGVSVHYRVLGDRGRPRLVFFNSLGSDLRIWEETVAFLAPRFEILLFDKRGHGLSEETPGPCTIERFSDDALAVLDGLGWPQASFVGLSIGGLIAQHIAIHAPERVEALVLMDTAARIGTREGWNERIARIENGGIRAISAVVASGWFTEAFAENRPAVFAAWRTMLEATPRGGYAAACAALREADYTDLVSRITAPTLALSGDADKTTSPDVVKATAGRIPGARFVPIEGAGHLPCLEQPAKVAGLIAGHVDASLEPVAGAPDRFENGMRVRRAVLGDAHVDRASAAVTPFDAPFQRFITEGAWGSVWSRPHFTRRERSVVTIALLAALGHDEEVAMHVRATRNTGASAEDIAEALLHVAVYAGVPAANRAIRIAKTVIAETKDTAA